MVLFAVYPNVSINYNQLKNVIYFKGIIYFSPQNIFSSTVCMYVCFLLYLLNSLLAIIKKK